MAELSSRAYGIADSGGPGAGLVFAYCGGPGKPAQPIQPEAIAEALAADDGWVWLHFDLVDQRSRNWIGRVTLPDAARGIFEAHDDALTLSYEDGTVHGACPDFQSVYFGGSSDPKIVALGRMCFAIGERLLVTGRRRPLSAVEVVRDGLKGGRLLPETPFDVFEAIVTAICRSISQRVTAAMNELDDIENELLTERVDDERQRLNAVRRMSLALHRPLAALLSAYRSEDRAGWPLPDDAQAVLQRIAGRLQALDHDMILVNDRAKLLTDEVSAYQADEMTRSLRALTLMSSLLLPGALVAGVFGMNTHDLPFAETSGGFWLALLLVAAATGVFLWVLRLVGVDLRR